ncbi:MAG: hypothetical protein SynsKO_28440 [Synoicihabitans sp.]
MRGRYNNPVAACGIYGDGKQVSTSPVDPGIGLDLAIRIQSTGPPMEGNL